MRAVQLDLYIRNFNPIHWRMERLTLEAMLRREAVISAAQGQLGVATKYPKRRWYEANTEQVVTDIQKRVMHPALR